VQARPASSKPSRPPRKALATSSVAVALSWLRDRPGVTAPILGARTLGQLTAALACETLDLPHEIREPSTTSRLR